MPFPKKFTEDRQRVYLETLAREGTVGMACLRASISREAVREQRNSNLDFRLREQWAMEDYAAAVVRVVVARRGRRSLSQLKKGA